jgi:hypothetical protein
VIASTVSGTVPITAVAGAAGGMKVGAVAASTGRRVTMVPDEVCTTVVSTGSVVIVRVITVCALALLAASAAASTKLEVARFGMGLAFIGGSVCEHSTCRIAPGFGLPPVPP